MNEQISAIQTREVLELMRNLAPILNQKELFEFMLFSNRVLKRYMPEHYNDGLSEEETEMRKDKAWLKEKVQAMIDEEHRCYDPLIQQRKDTCRVIMNLIDQLDEPEVLSQEWVDENVIEGDFRGEQEFWYGRFIEEEKVKNLLVPKQDKPVIPQFISNWIESYRKKTLVELINDAVYSSDEDSRCFRRWFHEEMGFESNYSEFLARAWLDGYEVEKEILWEIPMPDLKTTGGHIQYLTYDPKAKTYFASRRNAQLKQTFNAKDLASVPTQYRHYAELYDFKKIEEVTE